MHALGQLQQEEGRRLLKYDHICSNRVPEEIVPLAGK